jgi:para-aminobenzoate synthetase component I
VFEVWSSDEPLAELEAHLAESGFFAADDLVADVFLGYGISRSLRRAPWPDPPEPCRLPLLAASIRRLDEQPPAAGRFAIGEWQRSWDDEGYAGAVESVQAAIARGDVYQVNLVQHLHAPFEGDPAGLAPALAALRPLHPVPLAGDGWAIV